MPAPGLDLGGTKRSLERNLEYWRNEASRPCPKCAERERQNKAAELDRKLRTIVNEELT